MSTAGLTFSAGPTRVSCSRSGRVTSVRHESHPGRSYLAGATLGSLRVDGVDLEPPLPEVLADVDEVEFVHTYPGRLRVVVRHAFAAGWGMRLLFSSLAERAQRIERAELRLDPPPGLVGWALPLGVTTAYSLLPDSGTGPLLGGVLRRGSADSATGHGLELTPFELPPGGRYVTQLQWDWYPSPRALGRERHPDAPSALFATAGESVVVRADEDVAVLVPSEVQATEAADHLELVADQPGPHHVELRSARGTTAFDLEWVAPLEAALAALVPQALAAPRSASGVVGLRGVSDALVVQHALALNLIDDVDEAGEALDLFTARIRGDDPEAAPALSPVDAAYLCREYARLGDLDLLAPASRALLGSVGPAPGLGLAATQLCLGLIVSGRPVEPVLGQLMLLVAALAEDPEQESADRAEQGSSGGPEQDRADGRVRRLAAELELIAVTSGGPGASGVLAPRSDVTRRIAALGTRLGAGLRGRAVVPLPVAELSHLLTVFSLLPDGLGSELSRVWGCSASALAAQAVPELLARLEHQPIGPAHAWLVLGRQTG